MATFEAPHGPEVVVLRDGTVTEFGRDATCGIRFAYAPVPDDGVARVAGRLVVAAGRVFVESTTTTGHRALEIRADGGPPVQLAHGTGHAPSSDAFEIHVHGNRSWRLQVAVRREARTLDGTSEDPPTNRVAIELTPAQQRVLRAYSAPVLRGLLEPATHKEVADELDLHPNTVREALYEIHARFFAAGIPLLDVSDKRIAVVEAARIHGLPELSG